MKAPGGRQNAPPTNHTIVQKYDFFASLRAACADFQAPRRRVARKKPCERRFSTTFGESGLLFAESPLLSSESPPLLRRRRTFKIEVQQIIRFFIGANLCLQMRFFCMQPVVGRLFPVVLSNRLGMQRPKAEAMCRLTEKKRSRVCSLD